MLRRVLLLIALLSTVITVFVTLTYANCDENGSSVNCDATDPDGYSNTSGGLDVTVEDGATVNSDSGLPAIEVGDNNTVTVEEGGTVDTVTSNGADGIVAGDNNGDTTNQTPGIVNNGTIDAVTDGIDAGDNNVIVNNGDITTADGEIGEGIEVDGGNIVTNNGDIDADDRGIQSSAGGNTVTNSETGTIEAGGEGVEVEGDNNTVNNDGTITSGRDGILVDIPVDGDPITNNTVTNTGTINANGVESEGIEVEGGNSRVENSGDINAGRDGVAFDDNDQNSNENSNNTVVNAEGGSISGGDDGIDAETPNTTVENSGSVTGGQDGVKITTGNVTNTSTGSIEGDNIGVVMTSGSIVNEGGVTGTVAAVSSDGETDVTNSAGASIDGNVEVGSGTVSNDGSITGDVSSDGETDVTNSAGASIDGNVEVGSGTVANDGTIAGGVMGAGDTDVMNTGTIEGETGIVGGDGAQNVTSTGTITGTNGVALDLLGDDDTVIIDDSIVNGLIDGGAGEGDILIINVAPGSCEVTGSERRDAQDALGSGTGSFSALGRDYSWTNFEDVGGVIGSGDCGQTVIIRTNRINASDMAAPVAGFCGADGAVELYAVSGGTGNLAVFASAQEIDAALATGGSSIAGKDAFALVALDGDTLQMQGPGGYTYDFDAERC